MPSKNAQLPKISLTRANSFIGVRNIKGQLCDIYTPLQNFIDSKTKQLGDFTSTKLNFDMEHPVDILVQDAYDGGVNLILNDGKNRPRLINSRFSVQEEDTFKITDHIGFKDSNVYEEDTFEVDTLLKQVPIKIPTISYDGLRDNGGKMPVGSYSFYFKLADIDGNETEVIAESGIVQCHIGDVNKPQTIRMGMQDENSGKSIRFTLSNLDPGFSYIRVCYERSSSSNDQAVSTTYHKIVHDYYINSDKTCTIEITGAENIIGISKEEIYVDYADINSVKTQTIANNVLLFGNVDSTEHDWEEIKRFTWRIIPRWRSCEPGEVGALNIEYLDPYTTPNERDERGFCYYNTKNVYYRVGYWPGETYRFGIVYIFEDNSLSPVIDLQGIDFNLVDANMDDALSCKQGTNDYIKLFYQEPNFTGDATKDSTHLYPSYLYDTHDYYFNKKVRTNSKGVIRFPEYVDYVDMNTSSLGMIIPKPLYINFDLTYIGYEQAYVPNTPYYNTKKGILFHDWKDVLKKHHIKGFFFVRQKRVPQVLAQGVIIGLTDKEHGSLPILKSLDNKFIGQSFLGQDRLIYEEGRTFKISKKDSKDYNFQAMLVPDAEMHEATYNQLFCSTEYCLKKTMKYTFQQDDNSSVLLRLSHNPASSDPDNPYGYITKLTNVQDGVKLLTNGEDFFSSMAGSAEEAHKTVDLIKIWKWTKPQDLTISTSLTRGQWGPYVGLSNPNISILEEYTDEVGELTGSKQIPKAAPFEYGEVYNITTKESVNPVAAIDLIFQKYMSASNIFYAISHRTELVPNQDCFRGDCYINMFTHRMNRNFIDPELPTNTKVVNPDCWAQNYGVRCTAALAASTHSNLTSDDSGWYIDDALKQQQKEKRKQALIYFLTGNLIGGILALVRQDDPITPEKLGLGDSYINPSKVVQKRKTKYYSNSTNKLFSSIRATTNDYYKLARVELSGQDSYSVYLETLDDDSPITFNTRDTRQLYPNGYANEIVSAFELYIGPGQRRNDKEPNTDLQLVALKASGDRPTRKKVNPKEQEQNASGLNLKALFKSDENWELHGIASINRADVNAVGLGQWITFPILSSTNYAMRDIDFSQATEEAKFNRKRSFYPLNAKDIHNPLRDSNVINGATKISMPNKSYLSLPKTPYFKQEYFTRVFNSFRDSSNSITNQFRLILQNAYQDYTKTHGSITKLVTVGNYVYIIFTHGIGVIDLSQIQGQSALNFLPPITILNPDLGSMWKDSIISTDSGIFGVDSVAKKIWRIQGNQVVAISDMKMQKFLNDNLDMSEFNFRPYVGHINIKSHYNKFKEDIMFTYYNDLLYAVDKQYSDEKYSVDKEGFITENGTRIRVSDNYVEAERLLPKWNKVDQKWQSYSDVIEEASKGSCVKWVHGLEWSLCYNLRLDQFVTFYDWIPLESANIDNIYFSFDRDGIEEIQQEVYRMINPQFYKGGTPLTNVNLSVPTNKHLVDSAFTNIVNTYTVKANYGVVTRLPVVKGYLVFYLFNPDNRSSITVTYTSKDYSGNIPLDAREYKFVAVPIESTGQFVISSTDTYVLIEPKQVIPSTYKKWVTSELCEDTFSTASEVIIKNVKDLGLDHYDLRNSDNSLPLWKHGQAGVYDNQGEILPTNWYGKQREFNFEFVVNDTPTLQKIFNNLKIVSNKTEPYKFEYEIVGEGYDWFKYKPFIHWANKNTPDDVNRSYFELLTTPLANLQTKYGKDFPEIPYPFDPTKPLKTVPCIKITLTDRINRRDRSYHRDSDYWTGVPKTPGHNDYTLNTQESIIVHDKQLSEYKVHTEQLGNNMSQFGRVRGNMQYLEDLWDIEIRPVNIKWAHLEEAPFALQGSKTDYAIDPSTGRLLAIKSATRTYSFGFELDTTDKTENTLYITYKGTPGCSITSNVKTDRINLAQGLINLDMRDTTKRVFTLSGIAEIEFVDPNKTSTTYTPFAKIWVKKFIKDQTETRHRDKYIKVKVRYSGEELALIQGIITYFDTSFA